MESLPLTPSQQKVFECAEGSNKNIFLTGKGGTGKSVLINALVNHGKKAYTLAAPTGLAALNIGGRTLHSLFRIPASQGIIDPTFNNFTLDDRVLKMIKYHIKCLIIDEVSMVRVDVFDYIDRLMRHAKGVPDLPFGGTQVIAVGDFYQLPPVVQGLENIQLKEAGYHSCFAFSSPVFETFQMMELKEVLRQKGDMKFIKILHNAREGKVNPPQINILNKCVGKEFKDDLFIRLCATNKQAKEINEDFINALDTKMQVYQAKESGQWPEYPCEQILRLKVGAHIIVKQNRADIPQEDKADPSKESQVVNGSLGVVIELPGENEVAKWVRIRLENGNEVKIYMQRFERRIKERIFDSWEERVVATFEQIPLALAWAISIHKSQGQTFDRAYVDARKIFAAGQLYVALSRVRSLDGLILAERINERKFFVNHYVREFFNNQ